MNKLPDIRRLITEDFPDQTEWIGKLIEPLNTFMEETVSNLNKNITFENNLAAEIIDLEDDGDYPHKLKWSSVSKPQALWIGRCVKKQNHTTLTDPVFCDWEFNAAGQLQINNIAGITATASDKYLVKLIIITG